MNDIVALYRWAGRKIRLVKNLILMKLLQLRRGWVINGKKNRWENVLHLW